jgi:hypothetical protein
VFGDLEVTAWVGAGKSVDGVYAQQADAGAFGGLHLYGSGLSLPEQAPGDRWQARGFFLDYYGTPELTLSERLGALAGAPSEPLSVDPNEIATGGSRAEALRSMLVSVVDVVVIDENPDAPRDYREFAVTGGLRIDDRLFPDLARTPVGTRYARITGILGYSFDDAKLWPRRATDLELAP